MRKTVEKGKAAKWVPLIAGMLFSFGILWFWGESILRDEMFFGETLFKEIEYMDVGKLSYLIYLIKIRGLQTAFVLFMCCIHKRKLGLGIWAWLTGCGFGIGGYAMLRKWELLGLPGYILILLPHYLCYFYAYIQCYNIDYKSQYNDVRTGNAGGIWLHIIAIVGVVIIGILLECYVNPFFVKIFSKLFL